MCQFCVLCMLVIHKTSKFCEYCFQHEYLSMINLFFALKSVNFTPQFLCSKPVPINRLSPIIYGQLTSDEIFLGAQHYLRLKIFHLGLN